MDHQIVQSLLKYSPGLPLSLDIFVDLKETIVRDVAIGAKE
jgi:hypothetical protein